MRVGVPEESEAALLHHLSLSLSPAEQYCRLPACLGDKSFNMTNMKMNDFVTLHLIFRPGRALASRPLAIPSLVSLAYRSPHAQVRAALVAILG